jgi:lysophospholipase L1-like esterase
MQEAMGGAGSAYTWARKSPALMAPDLIHFTPAGYRELANRFMTDLGLTAP